MKFRILRYAILISSKVMILGKKIDLLYFLDIQLECVS